MLLVFVKLATLIFLPNLKAIKKITVLTHDLAVSQERYANHYHFV